MAVTVAARRSAALLAWLRNRGGALAIFVLLFLLWEFAVRLTDVKEYLLPPPSKVWTEFWRRHELVTAGAWVTTREILAGYALAVVVSIPLALTVAYSRFMEQAVYPVIVFLQIIPKIAIAPLFIIWFGFGFMPKLLLVFLLSFFPIVVSSIAGFKSADRDVMDFARTTGAGGLRLFLKISLPQALPHIFTELKVGAALAATAAVVAEFVASDKGLGYLLLQYNGQLDTPMVFATIVLLSLIGLIVYYAVEVVERLALPWHVSQQASANTVQVVAAGSDTFGLADSSSVILTASKGADVKSVMSLLNTTGFSVVSLAESGIKTPKDLEGRTVAVTPGDPLGQLLQAVCKANGVDCAKIGMVPVDPAAKVGTVLEKKADALLGGADDQYFLIKYKGANPAAMRYADWGANIVGMTILTSGDTIKKNPDLVRRFVRASVKSWEETKKNPGAAVDAALKAKPDLNRQSTLDQLMVDIDLLDSKNSKGRIGWGAQGDWDQTLAILKNYRDLQTDKTWTAFHTNEFLPR